MNEERKMKDEEVREAVNEFVVASTLACDFFVLRPDFFVQ
jgi:hypothetical protein